MHLTRRAYHTKLRTRRPHNQNDGDLRYGRTLQRSSSSRRSRRLEEKATDLSRVPCRVHLADVHEQLHVHYSPPH